METKGFHRRLTAIVSADVAGYSRLMQDDEAATVATLGSYRQIIADLVKQHRGRVVDSPGDNILSEFASVVDAVQCAVAVQKELQARNAQLPENRKMQFRIGVNLGDVIEEESRIYGDGVNIAARLESLADPGGICVSKTAFDHIESKLPLGYEFLGEQPVKNIAKPVGAYKVLMESRVTQGKGAGFRGQGSGRRKLAVVLSTTLAVMAVVGVWLAFRGPADPPPQPVPAAEKADPGRMALPLPDVPSIAVLPFASMGDDPKTELLSDGITESVVGALSKVPQLLVISRSSTSAYKDKTVKVKQVSEELGVQYVLEGSVQKSGDRIRITAQLADALSGRTAWTERYDRDLADVFALQDEITLKILSALRLKFGQGELAAIVEKHYKGGQSLDCYLKFLESSKHNQRWNADDNAMATRLAEEAVAQCPESPMGYTALGWAYHHSAYLGGPVPRNEAIEKSFELARKALAIDDAQSGPYNLLAALHSLKREHDKALAAAERAVALNPGSTDALNEYGWAFNHAGRWSEAIPVFEKAIRLNPYGKATIFRGYGVALIQTGRVDAAVAPLKKAVQRSPNDIISHLVLVRAYSMLDKEKDAGIAAAEVLRINPKFSLEAFEKSLGPARDQAERDSYIYALRKAGLPDKPPSAQP
jgi:adenylate cyclase